MFQWKRIDSLRVAVCLILFLFIPAAGLAAETALCGEWVFADLPGKTVIRLNEDGSAFYGGQNLTWDDTEEGLLLTDAEGASVTLRYALSDSGMVLYLPSAFERISDIGGEGQLVGSWKAGSETSQSSFVFTEDGRFLEDGVFSGYYFVDNENDYVLLQYGDLFQDTGIYYWFADDGYLYIAYPWKLARK